MDGPPVAGVDMILIDEYTGVREVSPPLSLTSRLAVAMILAQLLDAATFLLAISLFPAVMDYEKGTLTGLLLASGGPPLAVLVKLSLPIASGVAAVKLPLRRRRLVLLLMGMGAASGVVGSVFNVVAIVQVLLAMTPS